MIISVVIPILTNHHEEKIMLHYPTLEKLKALKLYGLADALTEQQTRSEYEELSFEERLGLLVDHEMQVQSNRKLANRLKKASFKQVACMEDINYAPSRGINKQQLLALELSDWVKAHRNLLIVGATGTGKSYLATALSRKACEQGYSSYYTRLPRLLPELVLLKATGRYLTRMKALAKFDILILDDWGLLKLSSENRSDLLELLEDRQGTRSTVVTSQLPVSLWHDYIEDSTLADAILDRLVHNAHRIELQGESQRKERALAEERKDSKRDESTSVICTNENGS